MHKEKLYDMLCEELDKVVEGGELTAGSLDTIDKLTHSIKSLGTIIAMEDYSEEGNSRETGRSSRGGRGGGNNRGNSYGYSYQRRDSRGRYSRNYSRDERKDQMMMELEEIMHDAPDEKSRKAVEKAIMQLDD